MDAITLPPELLGLVPIIVWAFTEALKRGLPIPPRILGFGISVVLALGVILTGLVDVGLGTVPEAVATGDPWLIGTVVTGVALAGWKLAQLIHDALQAAGLYGSGGDGGPQPPA